MDSKILHHFYKEHFELAIGQLEEFAKTRDPECLHEFRVNNKKIRSVFKFLRKIEHSKKIKSVNLEIRSIFLKAGEVRELQLRLTLLRRLRKVRLIEFYGLANEVREKGEQFVKNVPAYANKFKKMMKANEHRLKKIEEKQIIKYLNKLFSKIKLRFVAMEPETEWHDQRKKAKQVLYAINWMEEKSAERLKKSALILQLDALQDDIGQWHDAILMEDWMAEKQAYLSRDKKTLDQIEKVSNNLDKSLNTLSKAIIKRMKAVGRMKLPEIGGHGS